MLSHLSVKNYALIEELEIDFLKGFSVVTGETGSGKSIMLGALGLILGERADLKALSQLLLQLTDNVDLRKYKKHRRGPKKEFKKTKFDRNNPHVSTFKLINA